ncbi:Prefoldin subunit-domain-containing protein [Kalaharituber pfeilii]|nr:Prefoldin subunit-domain-containing protein [Kalaharituber pfeilii]
MMSRRMLSRDEEAPDDIEVTPTDQSQINLFSTLHSKHSVLQSTLSTKHTEKEALTDVLSELELVDDDELVPYRVGDAFVYVKAEEARGMLEKEVETVEGEIREVEEKVGKGKEKMEELKVGLYAKFGKAINLEA